MFKKTPTASGLDFIRIAVAAMPTTVGDHMRASVLCDLMRTAIQCRFRFSKEDAVKLSSLGFRCQYGIFAPLDYYTLACQAGGTYAAMWEAYNDFKPWMASQALVQVRTRGELSRIIALRENQRVAEGVCVLLPRGDDSDASDLEGYNDMELWRCTSISKSHIVICRYRKGKYAIADHPGGSPVKRWKLGRDTWETLNPKRPKDTAKTPQEEPASA